MHLHTFFTLRFQALIAGIEFDAEVECANSSEARDTLDDLGTSRPRAKLQAALVDISLASQRGNDCYQLDYESRQIYAELMRDYLRVGPEHFYHAGLTPDDYSRNRTTLDAMSATSHVGTLRFSWEKGVAALDFDLTVEYARQAVEALLQIQQVPHFRRIAAQSASAFTDESQLWDDEDAVAVQVRRTEFLYAAGLWPAEDGQLAEQPDQSIQDLLVPYAALPVPA
jgi:hypothetical protein